MQLHHLQLAGLYALVIVQLHVQQLVKQLVGYHVEEVVVPLVLLLVVQPVQQRVVVVLVDVIQVVVQVAVLDVQEDVVQELLGQLLLVCNYVHTLVVVIAGEYKEDGINLGLHILIVLKACVILIVGHSVLVLVLMVIRQLMHVLGIAQTTALGIVICVVRVIVAQDAQVVVLVVAVLDALVAALGVVLVALQAVLTHVKMDVEAAVVTVPVGVTQLVLMDAVIIALVHVRQIALGNALLLQMLKE